MRPTASHNIRSLTAQVPISQAEAGVWTKIMMNIVNLKIKVTRKTLKLLQLRKLKQRGVGVNEVEEYASKEVVRGGGRSREWKEKRRQEVVNVLMKGKIKSAEVELKEARWQFARLLSYLRSLPGGTTTRSWPGTAPSCRRR